MSKRRGRLISVDGVNGTAVERSARAALKRGGRSRGGISRWDASGLFDQLGVAAEDAGAPSPRTLLLLYAADLAFRIRWQIEPALAEGKMVVAAPYVETAIAFGRGAGLSGGWLRSLFQFALRPVDRLYVDAALPRSAAQPKGFIEFACAELSGRVLGFTRQQLASRARAHLGAAAERSATSKPGIRNP